MHCEVTAKKKFIFFLIYIIDNRSAFIDDLHTYVHAAELHYHHFLHSQNEHELFTLIQNDYVEEQHICISPDRFNTTKEMFEFC